MLNVSELVLFSSLLVYSLLLVERCRRASFSSRFATRMALPVFFIARVPAIISNGRAGWPSARFWMTATCELWWLLSSIHRPPAQGQKVLAPEPAPAFRIAVKLRWPKSVSTKKAWFSCSSRVVSGFSGVCNK